MKDIILFDLDGTLVNIDHRKHIIDASDPDWDAFEKECIHDSPIEATIMAAQGFIATRKQVWVWTGRSDLVLRETEKQLQVFGVPYHQLLMRPHGDLHTTSELKRGWLNNSPVQRDRVLCAYDDDPYIISMLRAEGLDCFHVREGKDDS